ncbi:10586_t:CDS:1, partial [Dentiscutata heterogama]
NSKNILLHENKAMIYNFSLSAQLSYRGISISEPKVKTTYTDPQCFLQANYLLDKRSDIYNLGMILWELTSGITPFYNSETDVNSIISQCRKEKEILGTPTEYINIYNKCWQVDPGKRPTLCEIKNVLDRLTNASIEFITNVTTKNSLCIDSLNNDKN